MVHLAIDELLRESAALKHERASRGDVLEVDFEASLLEIYNEKVLDLMAPAGAAAGSALDEPSGSGGNGSSSSLHAPPPEPLEVRAASDGSVSVAKLRVVPVSTAEEIGQMLVIGGRRRHTHGTLMNASSSRSHLVLTIYVTVRSGMDGSELKGKLHLVDLAGSERVGKSGVVGEQMREAQHINKSLSSLEQVMLALQNRQAEAGGGCSKAGGGGGGGNKGSGGAGETGSAGGNATSHVPYRNSKLTLLLSDALGAKGSSAKTIMIMNVSPAPSSCPETLRTLKFGERCQAVCLGTVKRGSGAGGRVGGGAGGSSNRAAEAAARNAEAAEERVAKLSTDLLESRRVAKDAEERAKAAEARAEALSQRLATANAQLAQAKLQAKEWHHTTDRGERAEREAGGRTRRGRRRLERHLECPPGSSSSSRQVHGCS